MRDNIINCNGSEERRFDLLLPRAGAEPRRVISKVARYKIIGQDYSVRGGEPRDEGEEERR